MVLPCVHSRLCRYTETVLAISIVEHDEKRLAEGEKRV